MEDLRNRVGAAVRAARRKSGLTQEALAERLGIATESLSAIERAVSAPSLETLVALVRELGLEYDVLLIGTEGRPTQSRERQRLEAEVAVVARTLSDDRLREWLEIGEVLSKRRA